MGKRARGGKAAASVPRCYLGPRRPRLGDAWRPQFLGFPSYSCPSGPTRGMLLPAEATTRVVGGSLASVLPDAISGQHCRAIARQREQRRGPTAAAELPADLSVCSQTPRPCCVRAACTKPCGRWSGFRDVGCATTEERSKISKGPPTVTR